MSTGPGNSKPISEEGHSEPRPVQLKHISSCLWTSDFKGFVCFICFKPSHSSDASDEDRDSKTQTRSTGWASRMSL